MTKAIQADNYFAIIPEWVLYAEMSSNAVRLYCVLRRYADVQGKCHPSRATLASQCQISQPTLSKAVEELVGIGALEVRHRKTKQGDYTSNQYTVVSINPNGVVKNVSPRSKDIDPTGSKEMSPQTRANINQSQEPTGSVAETKKICEEWWNAQEVKPLGKRSWYALNSVVGSAVERGFTSQQILTVLNDVGSVPSVREMDSRLRNGRKTLSKPVQEPMQDRQLEDCSTQVLNFVRLRKDEQEIIDYILGKAERLHEPLLQKLVEFQKQYAR